MENEFRGVFAPLTTPFDQEKISPHKLKENIEKYNSFELSGYVILGSSGESVYLTDEESEQMVQTAIKAAAPGKKIIVGTARESTRNTLDFTKRMATSGIDAVLVRTPSYYKGLMNHDALKKHYFTLAEQSRVPVIIYNIPRLSGISVDSQLVIELAKHPNIAGIKDSSGNLAFLGEIIPQINPRFNVLLGAGSQFFPGLMLGAKGGILALADVVPGLCVKLFNLFYEKKWEESIELQQEVAPLNKAIIHTYGIPAIKYALDLLGFHGGPCRFPILPLEEGGKKTMEEILNKLKLL